MWDLNLEASHRLGAALQRAGSGIRAPDTRCFTKPAGPRPQDMMKAGEGFLRCFVLGHSARVPEIAGQPKTTEIYSLTVLETRSTKSALMGQNQGVGGPPSLQGGDFFASSTFRGLQVFLACGRVTPVSASVVTSSSVLLLHVLFL